MAAYGTVWKDSHSQERKSNSLDDVAQQLEKKLQACPTSFCYFSGYVYFREIMSLQEVILNTFS